MLCNAAVIVSDDVFNFYSKIVLMRTRVDIIKTNTRILEIIKLLLNVILHCLFRFDASSVYVYIFSDAHCK